MKMILMLAAIAAGCSSGKVTGRVVEEDIGPLCTVLTLSTGNNDEHLVAVFQSSAAAETYIGKNVTVVWRSAVWFCPKATVETKE